MSHGARMNVKLVLDTCAMRDRDFIQWLTQRKSGEVCLPSVAYMELYRQTIAGKRSAVGLSELLKKCNIKILPFENARPRSLQNSCPAVRRSVRPVTNWIGPIP